MGAPRSPQRSSLERLKALDELREPSLQLQEAIELCSHPARAEMILKWVLEKLKKSSVAQTCKEYWEILLIEVRVVPAQKVAVLLASNAFVQSLKATFIAEQLSQQVVVVIARSLNLLESLTESPGGTHVASILSFDSPTAASFCSSWLRHVHDIYKGENWSLVSQERLLDPAFRIWAIRKQTPSDYSLFASQCAVIALRLLSTIDHDRNHLVKKRKRNGDDVDVLRSYVQSLESLLAKNVTLPTRAMFLKKMSGETPQPNLVRINIKETLEPLRVEFSQKQPPRSPEIAARLLDIAVRAVPKLNARQRLRERPWIEVLFTELQTCFSNQPRTTANKLQIGLLETLHRHSLSLSPKLLTGMIWNHALPSSREQSSVDWPLISKIIKMDASIMTDVSMTKAVADAISEAQRSIPDQAVSEMSASVDLWLDQIVVPTMSAFAQSRRLEEFIALWYEQLCRPDNAASTIFWTRLATPFAAVLESSLQDEQFQDILNTYSSRAATALNDLQETTGPADHSKLRGSLVLTCALLDGMQMESLLAKVQISLEALSQALLHVFESNPNGLAQSVKATLWSALSKVFAAWFPLWTKQTADMNTAAAQGELMLSSHAFKTALESLSTAATNNDIGSTISEADMAPQLFVETICHAFMQGYGARCSKLCTDALNIIFERATSASILILNHPEASIILPEKDRKAFVAKAIRSATDTKDGKTYAAVMGKIRAMTIAFASLHDRTPLNDMTEYATELLTKSAEAQGSKQDHRQTVLSVLSSIPPNSLTKKQREHLLDVVLELPMVERNLRGATQFQERLALMLHFLAAPCSSAQLFKDTMRIWCLPRTKASSKVKPIDAVPDDNLVNAFAEGSDIMCAVIGSVVRSWLTSQNQEHHLSSLVTTSEQVKVLIERDDRIDDVSSIDGLLVERTITIVIRMLEEGVRPELQTRMAHRDPETICRYIRSLLTIYVRSDGVSYPTAQSIALGALAEMPASLLALARASKYWSTLEIDVLVHQTLHNGESKLYGKVSSTQTSKLGGAEDDALARPVVRKLQMLCKYSTDPYEALVETALDALEHLSTAREQAAVLLTFEDAFVTANDTSKEEVLLTLTLDDRFSQASSLLLLHTALKVIVKDDMDSMTRLSLKSLIHRVLDLVVEHENPYGRQIILEILAVILREKPFLVDQYMVEQTISAVQRLLAPPAHSETVYLSICQISTVLLLHQRSRLQGRFHLMDSLFQNLISALFHHTKPSEQKLELAIRHARALARLLELFCRPPQMRNRSKSSDLIDEVRKAQAQAGQFVQYILHHYCAQVLKGSLGDGVREALSPGLWSLIEAIEVSNADGIKALSAAMNNSERAVLRTVYDDWKRFGKWEGL